MAHDLTAWWALFFEWIVWGERISVQNFPVALHPPCIWKYNKKPTINIKRISLAIILVAK